jgi:hypothetical protein
MKSQSKPVEQAGETSMTKAIALSVSTAGFKLKRLVRMNDLVTMTCKIAGAQLAGDTVEWGEGKGSCELKM